MDEQKFWNPYLAGLALGLVLLASFVLLGKGLGASGAAYHAGVAALATIAPEHVANHPVLGGLVHGEHPLDHFLVFEVLGVFLGGLVAAYTGGRLKLRVVRGPRISPAARLTLAFAGGTIMGMAARLARGCTSGQALSGGALLSAGSWAFMMMVFAGGYALAWFMRRQWT
jgi:uncharacterized membrane protein YedE/YeeE